MLVLLLTYMCECVQQFWSLLLENVRTETDELKLMKMEEQWRPDLGWTAWLSVTEPLSLLCSVGFGIVTAKTNNLAKGLWQWFSLSDSA